MSDTLYLKRRGDRWYFQMAVPKDLQKRYRRSVIIEALGTSDFSEARRLRWEHFAEAQDTFDRLRGGTALTSAEIELEAQATYQRLLEEADEERRAGREPYAMEPEAPRGGQPDPDADHVIVGLAFYSAEAREDLQRENFSRVADRASEIVRRTGADMPEGSEKFRELCRSLLRAHLEAFAALRALREGRPYETGGPLNPAMIDPVSLRPRAAARSLARPKSKTGTRVSEAAARYVAEKMRDARAGWTEQTRKQYEATYRLFSEFVSDAAVTEVTREDASGFLDAISTLDKHWARSPKTRGLPLRQLLERCSGGPGLTNTTLNRHATALSGLFKWARRQGLVKGESPFSEMLRSKGRRSETTYLPFEIDELNALFHAPLFSITSYDQRSRPNNHTPALALQWAMLIALFSGMRSGEICQLRVDDVRRDQGVWFFDIREDGPGQRVKTEAGIRMVPVHSTLMRCGFLDYLAAAKRDESGQLFPALKHGGPDGKLNWYQTRKFTALRRLIGVTRPRTSFHSFRTNVGTALERARVPESEAVQVLGHEKLSMSYSLYSIGVDLKARSRDVVEKIGYEGLDLSHLYAD